MRQPPRSKRGKQKTFMPRFRWLVNKSSRTFENPPRIIRNWLPAPVHRPGKTALVLRFSFLPFFFFFSLLSNTVRFDDLNGHGATCYLRRRKWRKNTFVWRQGDESALRRIQKREGISVDFRGKKLGNSTFPLNGINSPLQRW